MNVELSSIEFRGYIVTKAIYSASEEISEPGKEFELNPSFSRVITHHENGRYSLKLGVKLVDDANRLPFSIDVEIQGFFVLKGFEDKEDKIMRINATAILFPYLRSTLSMLTSLMNVNPVVLPTINLVKMFENDEKDQKITK